MIDLETIRRQKESGRYRLRQLGTTKKVDLSIYSVHNEHFSWRIMELFDVVILRTQYLNDIIPCAESANVIKLMKQAKDYFTNSTPRGIVTALVEGHVYQVVREDNKALTDKMVFIRRSGNAITYESDWPGIQTQELLRAMIDSLMLYRRTWGIADLCRQALWEYEARAYRRKRQELNRDQPEHQVTSFPYDWDEIETMGIGEDGHIQYLESEVLYHLNFGVCEAEPIPGVDPFTFNTDPVYIKTGDNLRRDMRP